MLETTFEQILTQLSKPAVRALTNEKSTVWMNSMHEYRKALLSLHGFGPKSIRTIEEITGKELKKGSPFRGDPFYLRFVFQHCDLIAVCFWLVRFCVALFVSFGVTSLIGVTTCFVGYFSILLVLVFNSWT